MMDMSLAQYKQCEGWKAIPKIPKKTVSEKNESWLSSKEERLAAKLDVGSEFTRFLNKGGHWSFT